MCLHSVPYLTDLGQARIGSQRGCHSISSVAAYPDGPGWMLVAVQREVTVLTIMMLMNMIWALCIVVIIELAMFPILVLLSRCAASLCGRRHGLFRSRNFMTQYLYVLGT
ncbi:hypothetical protein LZ32DRAFT_610198 [Colletotrichum eremochloae]|nr:hypothetical protein LZ32DRAFT_610198 [Colletotrichum eremochloae]